jgi:DNA mismatch repair protein MutH
MQVRPPRSEQELLERAEALAGRTLGWVAARQGMGAPPDLRRAKGWPGTVLEVALGATSTSRAAPDFPHLGIELKTIPVTAAGRATEATYVCRAPLDPGDLGTWETSWVRAKLRRVVWVPIVGTGAPADRVVGAPVVWSPTEDDDDLLRADWEEVASLVALGELGQLDGRRGRVLQVRPKAADGTSTVAAVGEDGEWVRETPRGFYLRASFTTAILARTVRGASSEDG